MKRPTETIDNLEKLGGALAPGLADLLAYVADLEDRVSHESVTLTLAFVSGVPIGDKNGLSVRCECSHVAVGESVEALLDTWRSHHLSGCSVWNP